MKELDTVVLRRALPEFDLVEGDVGAVVHVHAPNAFEVEFVTGEGTTLAVATLSSEDLRPIDAHELLHVRSVAHR
ncbi:MAG: DUF4926 domain-containing protein [Gemmatimonadota bacterium]|nr:DUF4926 domain-containing protein [Gemmatimonadota bacterium]